MPGYPRRMSAKLPGHRSSQQGQCQFNLLVRPNFRWPRVDLTPEFVISQGKLLSTATRQRLNA